VRGKGGQGEKKRGDLPLADIKTELKLEAKEVRLLE